MNSQAALRRDQRIVSALLVGVVAIGAALSLVVDWRSFDSVVTEIARARGAALFRLVELTHRWNARHGGVYVPFAASGDAPAAGQSSPDRGARDGLALVDPTRMMRQIIDLAEKSSGFVLRLSSRRPLGTEFPADAWESAALERFELGLAEAIEFSPGAVPAYRYMAPLRVESACLKCHTQPGDRLGQIRGGISVTMPADELLAWRDVRRRQSVFWHLLIFGVLSSLVLALAWRSRRHAQSLAQANAALLGRETLLKQILDTSSVAIFLVDNAGRVVQANQRMAQMFGVALATLVGYEYVALLHPTQRAEAALSLNELLTGSRPSVTTVRRYWRADHSEFWGRVSATPFRDADGGDAGAVVEIVDVSVSKQAEEALAESEFLWKFAIEGAGDGVWDWNIATGEAAYSTRWKSMLGYSDDDILPSNDEWSSRVHPDDQAPVAAAMQDYLDGRTAIYVVEYRLRCKDGSYKWILGRGMIVARDAEDRPLRMIGTHTDISERKAMEEQIRQMAFYDPLTRLPNRRLLHERLGQAMAASRRSGRHAALMFLDLDNFKPLNDAHGHGVGDLLLCEVADRLCGCVREMDTVARFGGDEFVVMLSELTGELDESRQQACAVAEKVRAVVAAPYRLPLTDAEGTPRVIEHRCTASIGVLLFVDRQYSQDAALQAADAAMYRAKQVGRNCVELC